MIKSITMVSGKMMKNMDMAYFIASASNMKDNGSLEFDKASES
jgi:hypothetical protein